VPQNSVRVQSPSTLSQNNESLKLFMQMENAYTQKAKAQKKESSSIIYGPEEIHKTLKLNTKSRFEQLQKLFEKSKMASIDDWKSELFMTGQCINRLEPEASLKAVADVYLIQNTKGIKQVYFLPSVGIDSLSKHIKNVNKLHQRKKENIVFFSPLHEQIQSGTPLSMMLSSQLRNKLLFTFSKSTSNNKSKNQKRQLSNEDHIFKSSGKLGDKIYYGLRTYHGNQKQQRGKYQ